MAFRYTEGTSYKVLPTQSNTALIPLLLFTQTLSDGHKSNHKCLPPAESVRPESLGHTTGVCCPASCHLLHHGHPAQQHSLCHLLDTSQPSQDQCHGHGHGGWHHHDGVNMHPADCITAHSNWGIPCLHANIQGARDPCIQLHAPH